MALGKLRRYRGWAIVIARTFLAITLLRGAFAGVSEFTFRTGLLSSLELLLGVAIAAGFLIRYAAAAVLLCTIAPSVLTTHFHLALLPPNPGTVVAVLIAGGILLCFGENDDNDADALIEENDKWSHELPCAVPHAGATEPRRNHDT